MLRATSLCLFVFVYAPLSISGANPPQQIAKAIAELPHLKASAPDRDWLVDSSGFKAGIYRTDDLREFALGFRRRDEEEIRLPIHEDGCVQLSVAVPANGMEWWIVR